MALWYRKFSRNLALTALLFFLTGELADLILVGVGSGGSPLSRFFLILVGVFAVFLPPLLFFVAWTFKGLHRHVTLAIVWLPLFEAAGDIHAIVGTRPIDLFALAAAIGQLPVLVHDSYPGWFFASRIFLIAWFGGAAAIFWFRQPRFVRSFWPWGSFAEFRANLIDAFPHGLMGMLGFGTLFFSGLILGVGQITSWNLELRATGLFSRISTWKKGTRTVVVYPMSHVGDRSFYTKLNRRYATASGVMLMEGIRDATNEERKYFNYSRDAALIAMSSQGDELLKDCRHVIEGDTFRCEGAALKYVNADVSLQEFTKDERREIVGAAREEGSQREMDFEKKREERLIATFDRFENQERLLVIPWGALHAAHIGEQLDKRGYRRTGAETESIVAFGPWIRRLLARFVPR